MVRRILIRKKMISFIANLCAVLTLSLAFAKPVFAQATAGPGGEQKTSAFGGPRKQLATIIFAGLGGAVLGLSTLSFYGRPQDNLRNIAFGAGAGIILGTIVVTYKAATNPSELYGANTDLMHPDVSSNAPGSIGAAVGSAELLSTDRPGASRVLAANPRPKIEMEIEARQNPLPPRGPLAFRFEF